MRRTHYLERINQAFKIHKVVALLGPRQCGKTTLANDYISRNSFLFTGKNYFDLEKNTDLARLAHPQLSLESLEGLIVIDEIQRIPELFPTIRVLVDHIKTQRYLILGSASRDLLKQSSETLAGRIQYIEVTPFSYEETHHANHLWLRGGFPLSYLADNDEDSYSWRREYTQTFLERDIPNLGIQIPATQLRRFWMMLAHYHGNIFNASEIGKALGLTHKTIRHYADILVGTFMLRELPPWFENISKRQVKSPKIYFRDSGILHYLLNIANDENLYHHPKLGSSWEGFALESVIRHHEANDSEYYFWATQSGAELDLLIIKNGKRLGFEFKYTDAPKITKSMTIAMNTLKLDKLIVIFPGKESFPLAKTIQACGLEKYLL
ncbi:MAG TPA: ATP-binding protein [Gammaproteobacteria bacterium]|nr:ATP-binding protein [Gammaproteobacteria bacterium]